MVDFLLAANRPLRNMKLYLIKLCTAIQLGSAYLMYRRIYYFVIADTYFGPGTVDTVKCHLNAVESKARIFIS